MIFNLSVALMTVLLLRPDDAAGNANFDGRSYAEVGTGWHGEHLFGGKDGVLFLVNGDKELRWYQATGGFDEESK